MIRKNNIRKRNRDTGRYKANTETDKQRDWDWLVPMTPRSKTAVTVRLPASIPSERTVRARTDSVRAIPNTYTHNHTQTISNLTLYAQQLSTQELHLRFTRVLKWFFGHIFTCVHIKSFPAFSLSGLCPTRHKRGHLGDILPDQSTGLVLNLPSIKHLILF